MLPKNVKPVKFRIHQIIYNNGEFAVAYGKWENSENRLAMRWNGYGEEIGYPNQGGNPLWFQLPGDEIWTSVILQAIDKIAAYEKRINNLNDTLNK